MKRVLFALYFVLVFCAIPKAVFAARLSISPSTASVSVGQTVSMSVVLASSDQATNAVSGAVTFPSSKLQVVSVSKTNSILSLWVDEPKFVNSSGRVTFEGVVPNPGFQGSKGTVINITFKAVASGSATVSFSQASVLANDGSGTDILSDFQSGTVNISGTAVEEKPVKTADTPDAPSISSPTHASPSKWYNATTAKFVWDVPTGVTASRYSFDKNTRATPNTEDSPATKDKVVEDIEEGTSYFHLQLKNEKGWGAIANFRVQVDATPPSTPIFDLVDYDENRDSPFIKVRSNDDLSGLAYYKVKFGDSPYETFNVDNNAEEISIPAKRPGKQTVLIEVFDNAGNKAISAKELNIKTIDAPVITDMPKILDKGQDLVIRGTALPDIEVRIYLRNTDDKEIFASTRSGPAGEFSLTWKEPLADGRYILTAEAVNSYGVMSPRSEERPLSVHPSILFRIGSFVVTIGSFVAFIIVVLAGLGYGGLILWKHFHRFRRRLGGEMEMIDRSVHTAFNMLKDEIREEVHSLQRAKTKRSLTKEEERIIEKFSTDVDDAERFIEKQIRDIKKQVR